MSMRIRILVTGGTFDKEYDELTGRLFFKVNEALVDLAGVSHEFVLLSLTYQHYRQQHRRGARAPVCTQHDAGFRGIGIRRLPGRSGLIKHYQRPGRYDSADLC